uniref:Leucine-rich repeat-containing N-terminal plant-type domain-containing protein n=1 Tax=Quercus lobata TaxID=97700 RepID=A0A7N2LE72_QUELO
MKEKKRLAIEIFMGKMQQHQTQNVLTKRHPIVPLSKKQKKEFVPSYVTVDGALPLEFSSTILIFYMHAFTLLLWCGLLVNSVVGGNNKTDRLALLEFKAKITDDPLQVMSSWNDSIHFCQWQGVTYACRHQRVITLNLRSSKLTSESGKCSSVDYQGQDFKALVYEFMTNGNVDEWLHPISRTNEVLEKQKNLNLLQRLNIAIGCFLRYG